MFPPQMAAAPIEQNVASTSEGQYPMATFKALEKFRIQLNS
jgi:hypothetical protein